MSTNRDIAQESFSGKNSSHANNTNRRIYGDDTHSDAPSSHSDKNNMQACPPKKWKHSRSYTLIM
jgi:hypothetical protein